MRLDRLPGNVNLTYCTKHSRRSRLATDISPRASMLMSAINGRRCAGSSLASAYGCRVKRPRAPRQPDALAAFRDQLADASAPTFTSTPPVGPFHGVRVLERAGLSFRTGAARKLFAFTAGQRSLHRRHSSRRHRWQHFHRAGAFKPSAERLAPPRMAARMVEAVATLLLTERRTVKHRASRWSRAVLFSNRGRKHRILSKQCCFKPESLDLLAARIGGTASARKNHARRHLGIVTMCLPWLVLDTRISGRRRWTGYSCASPRETGGTWQLNTPFGIARPSLNAADSAADRLALSPEGFPARSSLMQIKRRRRSASRHRPVFIGHDGMRIRR